jgi:hypothetical protein
LDKLVFPLEKHHKNPRALAFTEDMSMFALASNHNFVSIGTIDVLDDFFSDTFDLQNELETNGCNLRIRENCLSRKTEVTGKKQALTLLSNQATSQK